MVGQALTDLRYALGFMRAAVQQLGEGNIRAALVSMSRAEDGAMRVEEALVRAVEAEQLQEEMEVAWPDLSYTLPDAAEECQACGGINHPGHMCSPTTWTVEEILANEG